MVSMPRFCGVRFIRKEDFRPDMNTHVQICVETADSFRQLAMPYFESLGTIESISNSNPLDNIGDMCSSAVCLSLALEMYIESILIAVGDNPPKTHNVYNSYLRLPSNIRHNVERAYKISLEKYKSKDEAGKIATKQFIIQSSLVDKKTADRASEENRKELEDKSILVILKRASESFTTWRYLFSIKESKDPTFLTYEFRYLDMICSVFKNEIDSLKAV